ncbi:hypothetical protein FRC03_008828 [Tulasnella sp. 419]|nr:hypothetical protein FRC02_009680 [Tulasnella sp. 418]KAG8958774.1 hypothetical protein FRC03_008828 [Tulasnella sp. 419]
MEMYLNFPASRSKAGHKRASPPSGSSPSSSYSPSIGSRSPSSAHSRTNSIESAIIDPSHHAYNLSIFNDTSARSSYPNTYSLNDLTASNAMSATKYSACPKCNHFEMHNYPTASRTCARCGHVRYFGSSGLPVLANPARTYWRPTQIGARICYPHIREGFEELDAPIHESLATWATYQKDWILFNAQQMLSTATTHALQVFSIELTRSPAVSVAGSPTLTVVNQVVMPLSGIQGDDLLGSFRVLEQEHAMAKNNGGKGLVVVVLTCQGASLALAARMDIGTI